MRLRMKNSQKSKLGTVVLIVSFFVFIVCINVVKTNSEKKLSKNIKHTDGIVVSWYGKQNGRFVYTLIANSKTYEADVDDKGANNFSGGTDEFIGKVFPVVYDSTEPGNSMLLLTPHDFGKYGMGFPDSLQWVLKYVRNE